jgi:signal transduction histidine kinase
MADIYEQKRDFEQSLLYFKKCEAIKDKIYQDQNNDKLNQIQELYEIEKKEKEIAQQKVLQKEQANVIKRQDFAFLIVLISLLIVLVLTLLLYVANNQKKFSNKRLKEINQVKDRLFSIIAHDLKSPLDSLQGTISLLNDNNLNEKELKFLVKGLSEKLNDTQNLLNNLLNWAKTQMKGIEVHPQPLYLALLVNEQFKIFSSVALKKNITLQSNINEQLEVFADLEMLKVILRNLISNAIKFTPQSGKISIESIKNTDENFCTISIEDTGVGISPEILPIIFEMKTYYSEQGTAQEKGTGLGLILAKDFVERNEGELWVKSTKNKGTTFYFTLPIHT